MSRVRFPSPAPDFSSNYGQLTSPRGAGRGNGKGNLGSKTDGWRQKVPRKSRVVFHRCSCTCLARGRAILGPTTVTLPLGSGSRRRPEPRQPLLYARGARFGGCDCEGVKACCVVAGLPVIDSGMVAFENVVRLAVSRPMPAVGEASNSPPYRAAGAEVFNVGGPVTTAMREE
jgi:hypothetical protein